jgi:hypothetical protein
VNLGKKQLFGSQANLPDVDKPGACWCLDQVEGTFPDRTRKEIAGKNRPLRSAASVKCDLDLDTAARQIATALRLTSSTEFVFARVLRSDYRAYLTTVQDQNPTIGGIMKLAGLLATILSTGIAHASPESVGLAVEQIQFCKTVNGEAEALTKAQLADGLIDPSRCFKANQWTEILHLQLIDQGYKMYRFILAHHIPNPQQQRLEIFVWYSNAATGKDLIFENSCELSTEAKEYILSHPQPTC